MFSKSEVLAKTSEYFENDELAPDVFMKYALRDSEGNLLEDSPDMMHARLAQEFARVEAKYPNPMSAGEIRDLLSNFALVIPQGSPMSGIGNPHQLQSLSNCFVIDQPYDSYAGILYTDQEQVQIMKRRGGVGFDISTIRPKGMPTSNAARTTDGIGVFMERFSNSCREVAQGGRRGALMLTIHCFEGSTLVLTDAGWKRIEDVVNNKLDGRVWTHEGWKEIEAYQKFEDSEIYEVEAENGKTIKVTADHKFVVKNIVTGEEYLKPIKEVDVENEELVFYDVSF
jgi:ribonucleotide reductase alpha subunit